MKTLVIAGVLVSMACGGATAGHPVDCLDSCQREVIDCESPLHSACAEKCLGDASCQAQCEVTNDAEQCLPARSSCRQSCGVVEDNSCRIACTNACSGRMRCDAMGIKEQVGGTCDSVSDDDCVAECTAIGCATPDQ